MVTHDMNARALATRTIALSDGRIVATASDSTVDPSRRGAFA
jgi:ABC-type lipoprotein export system ATPase subunit